MGNFINEKNRIYGKLTVLKRDKALGSSGQACWLCKCECGNETTVRGSDLRTGNIQSCGCLRKLPRGVAAMRHLLSTYKWNAKNRNLLFELTEEEFEQLTSQNCYYCDTPPGQTTKNLRCNGDYTYSGLDRINNEKGYTFENVVPCCGYCNWAKRDKTYDEFREWISRVNKNLNLK